MIYTLDSFQFTFDSILNGELLDYALTILVFIWGLITNFFSSLVTGFGMIFTVVNFAITLPAYFPSVLGSCILVVIIVSVVKIVTWQDHQ